MSDSVIEDARLLKARAMDARDNGNFNRAKALINRAERALQLTLQKLVEQREAESLPPGAAERDVRKQLANILGTKGSIFRRRVPAEYRSAADAYDEGNEFERWVDKHGDPDSYNLVQRLVVRAVYDPDALSDASRIVYKESLPAALREAQDLVASQLSGKRREDAYAAADYAVICMLLSDPEWPSALKKFISLHKKNPGRYAFEVTLKTLQDIKFEFDSKNAPEEFRSAVNQACIMLEESRV